MITLCKINLFLIIIFIFASVWMKIINIVTLSKPNLYLFFQFMYTILFIILTYLSIRCGYWFLFEYWRWGL